MNHSGILRRIYQDHSGGVAPLIGLSMLLLVLTVGIAIDSARTYLVRGKVQNALDAALIGAADVATQSTFEQNPDAIRQRGVSFFYANFPEGYLGTDIGEDDITINFDPDTGRVSGSVNASVDYVFQSVYDLVGETELTVNQNIGEGSEVLRTVGAKTEVAFAMDYSYSMCFKEGTGRPWGEDRVVDARCNKFRNMELRVRQFVEQIQSAVETANDGESAAYFSFIPYSHTVRVNGNINDTLYCLDENLEASRLPSATGLVTDPSDALLARLFGIDLSTEGGTNSAYGFWWAWASLRSDSTGLFGGVSAHELPSEHPSGIEEVENLSVSKTLILLTDGANEYPNRRCDANFRILSERRNEGFHSDDAANARLAEMCEGAKREGIEVCTILYDVPPSSDVGNLLRACAVPGCAYNATDDESLAEAFDSIANRLIDLRITR